MILVATNSLVDPIPLGRRALQAGVLFRRLLLCEGEIAYSQQSMLMFAMTAQTAAFFVLLDHVTPYECTAGQIASDSILGIYLCCSVIMTHDAHPMISCQCMVASIPVVVTITKCNA